MKNKWMNHLVSFRYGMVTLYGEVVCVNTDDDGNSVYIIQGGNVLYKNVEEKDILHDFGIA